MARARGVAGRRPGTHRAGLRVFARRTGRWLGAVCLAAGWLAVAGMAASARASALTADVTLTGQSQAIPSGFFSLSIEYTELPDYEQLGSVFDNVISLLRAGDGSPMLLRLGGRSADQVLWMPPAAGGPAPTATTTDVEPVPFGPRWVRLLAPRYLRDLASLVRRDSLRVELELNLAVHSPAMAAAFLRAAQAALPRRSLTGIAIGNEPDLYRKQPWLGQERTPSTVLPISRLWPLRYTAQRYRLDYLGYARALRRIDPAVPITAPDITHPSLLWPDQLLALGRLAPQSYAFHRYATATCKTTEIHLPTVTSFLDDRYTHGLASTMAPDISLIHAHHHTVRVTEMNSFTCGGRRQIAESFATALWAPDALFEMLHAGIDGVSWHIHPGLPNAPFHVTPLGIAAFPEMYGLAVFQQMLGPRPEFAYLHMRGADRRTLKVWAVRSVDGLKVLAINKGPRPIRVEVHDTSARGTARLAKLLAPRLTSAGGVTFAGQSIGTDGRWHGLRIEQAVPDQNGVYAFWLPRYAASVLSVG